MKLRSMKLTNFLCHREATLDLSRPLTCVFGPNDSGKSAIADAVKWCWLGRCRSTTYDGKGSANLITLGAEEMSVTVAWMRGTAAAYAKRRQKTTKGTLEFGWRPEGGVSERFKQAEARRTLWETLGTTPDLLECVLDAPHWFSLGAERQSELLARALELDLSTDAIMDAARERGMSDDALDALEGSLGRFVEERGAVALETFPLLHERAYERRRVVRNEWDVLKAQAAAPAEARPLPSREHVDGLRERIAGFEKTEAGINRSIGAIEGKERQARELNEAIDELAQQMKNLPLKLTQDERPPVDVTAIETEIKMVEERLTELRHGRDHGAEEDPDVRRTGDSLTARGRTMTDAEDARDALSGEHDGMKQSLETLERNIKRIESGSTECPSIHKPKACPLSEEQMEAERAGLPDLKKQLAAKRGALTKKAKELAAAFDVVDKADVAMKAAQDAHAEARQTFLDEIEQRIREETKRLDGLRVDLRNAEREAGRREAGGGETQESIGRQISALRGQLAKIGDPAEERRRIDKLLDETRHQKQEVQRKLDAALGEIEAAKQRDGLTERRDEKEHEWRVLEEVTTALRHDGLPAAILGKAAKSFVDGLNGELAKLTDTEYRVDVAFEKKLALNVYRGGSEAALPVENLCESGRFRIGLSIAAALSRLEDLGILVIDRADVLVGRARELLSEALDGFGMESVLLFASMDYDDFFQAEVDLNTGTKTYKGPKLTTDDKIGVYWLGDGGPEAV